MRALAALFEPSSPAKEGVGSMLSAPLATVKEEGPDEPLTPERGPAPSSAAASCLGVDEQGNIVLRAHKTSLLAAVLPALGLLCYAVAAVLLGPHDHRTSIAGELFLLSIGLAGLGVATAQMVVGCECKPSGGAGAEGAEAEQLPESVRMLLCAVGITVSFLFYGYVLESITSDKSQHFPEVIGILLNSVVYVGVSRLALFLQGQAPARVHARQFGAISLSSKLATCARPPFSSPAGWLAPRR